MSKKKLLIICGATASGKSYLGHYLAKLYEGEIINSDSMQIYQQIPILTASPSSLDRQEITYHLYNFLPIDQEFSVIKYLHKALEKIHEVTSRGKLPIIIGGTGLYINALLFGYNEMPDISPNIRQYVRNLHSNIGQLEFFSQLQKLDKIVSQKLQPADCLRSIRSYEIFMQTGKSILDFQKLENIQLLSQFNSKVIFLHPERKFLYNSCNERLEKLFNNGAIEEIELVIKNFPHTAGGQKLAGLPPCGLKAIGVTEICDYLNNQLTFQEALSRAQTKTRQYAKRQITWFKNQIKDKLTLEYSSNLQFEELIERFCVEGNLR